LCLRVDEEFKKQVCADLSKADHDYYYGSYSSYYIHEEMLKDSVRTRAYMRAIEDNPECFKDKIVLDIGCGTGILSIFAARAGAKHVYAIENAEIALYAREIIKRNGFEKTITVVKGKMEEVKLPVDKVDIIISEWMGYFLLYESMLDSVLWARDKYLVKGGLMFPDKCQMFVAAIEDGHYKQQKRTFWNDVYAVDMSCLAPTVMREPLVDVVPSKGVLSSSCKVLELDLCTMKPSDVEFACGYQVKINYDDKVHGLIGWWDASFSNLPNQQLLSTSPFVKATHWKQTVFYSSQDMIVNRGDTLHGSIACRQSLNNKRELDIKISYHIDNDDNKRDFTNLYKLR
jgi:type I protein arginine methyltransferase